MRLSSLKKLRMGFRTLQRAFGGRGLKVRVDQGGSSEEGLRDRENQDAYSTDDLRSASNTTSPDSNSAISLSQYGSFILDCFTGYSEEEIQAATQRTRRNVLNLEAYINYSEARDSLIPVSGIHFTAQP